MSVERLYPNLSSSGLPWNRLPSVIFIILASEDSEEEDGYDKEDEEDERLQCFFLRDLCLLGEKTFLSTRTKKYFYSDVYSWSTCFCTNFFSFLCLVVFLPLFRFSETTLGEFPVQTSP